ncbi:MAG TPA: hypothetical protein VI566_07905 [Xanthomonadales bacterium]|nr:hypothetical protein [Xanthomonadales bacterium]
MTMLQRILPISICLAILLLTAACSDDDTPAPAETAARDSVNASTSEPDQAGSLTNHSGSGFDPIIEYDSQCPAEDDNPSLECEWLRALAVADVVEALEQIERSRDQRGVEEAMAALDLSDEPEILVAACQVLGRFPDTPGIAEKVTPLLLDSPYLEVQRMAAHLLSRTPEPALAAMGSQWLGNHNSAPGDDPYAELPGVPAHYWDMDFPDYQGAEWFTPADSDRSVGWISSDAAAEVAARLSEILGVPALDYQQWADRSQQQMLNAAQAIDQSKIAEAEKLMQEYLKSQDPRLLETMQRLQEEAYAPLQRLSEGDPMKVDQVATPPSQSQYDQVFYLIAEERDGHVARLILVYRQAAIDRTVMQMAWDLRDYPPAWE